MDELRIVSDVPGSPARPILNAAEIWITPCDLRIHFRGVSPDYVVDKRPIAEGQATPSPIDSNGRSVYGSVGIDRVVPDSTITGPKAPSEKVGEIVPEEIVLDRPIATRETTAASLDPAIIDNHIVLNDTVAVVEPTAPTSGDIPVYGVPFNQPVAAVNSPA